ncbi:hypothetical protein SAMN03159443_00478 [Pseudomonas sp. NFACC15-1]|nr:hypothetical protein SAMN03159443_00478 [Pseudomonas sp. NFACC15-1]
MSQCLGQCAVCGRTTGSEEPKQKNAATRIARKARRVCDVFVVGGATAVGYLWVCLSEICANSRDWREGYREQARSHNGFAVFTEAAVTLGSCRSEPARDSGRSVKGDVECRAAIASKLGSHSWLGVFANIVFTSGPVGASLLAIAVGQSKVMLNAGPPSRASSAPTVGWGCSQILCSPLDLWERACSRWRQARRYKAFSRATRSWQ